MPSSVIAPPTSVQCVILPDVFVGSNSSFVDNMWVRKENFGPFCEHFKQHIANTPDALLPAANRERWESIVNGPLARVLEVWTGLMAIEASFKEELQQGVFTTKLPLVHRQLAYLATEIAASTDFEWLKLPEYRSYSNGDRTWISILSSPFAERSNVEISSWLVSTVVCNLVESLHRLGRWMLGVRDCVTQSVHACDIDLASRTRGPRGGSVYYSLQDLVESARLLDWSTYFSAIHTMSWHPERYEALAFCNFMKLKRLTAQIATEKYFPTPLITYAEQRLKLAAQDEAVQDADLIQLLQDIKQVAEELVGRSMQLKDLKHISKDVSAQHYRLSRRMVAAYISSVA